MDITASSALWFLPLAAPVALYVAWTDLSQMRIPNKAGIALVGLFAVGGLLALPFEEYAWRYMHLVIVLLAGIILNAAGAIGAGDAKFAAASAPFVAAGDLMFVFMIFTATLLGTWVTHRLVKNIPALRQMAPNWKSWATGWDYPMGFALGGTLIFYLMLGALFGT